MGGIEDKVHITDQAIGIDRARAAQIARGAQEPNGRKGAIVEVDGARRPGVPCNVSISADLHQTAVSDIQPGVSRQADVKAVGDGPGRPGAADRHRTRGTAVADAAICIADGPAVGNVQRAVAIVADVKVAGIGPGRVVAADRHRTRGTGRVADIAICIADGPFIGNVQRAVAFPADEKVAGIGPGRTGAADRHRTRGTGLSAYVANRIADPGGAADRQRAAVRRVVIGELDGSGVLNGHRLVVRPVECPAGGLCKLPAVDVNITVGVKCPAGNVDHARPVDG